MAGYCETAILVLRSCCLRRTCRFPEIRCAAWSICSQPQACSSKVPLCRTSPGYDQPQRANVLCLSRKGSTGQSLSHAAYRRILESNKCATYDRAAMTAARNRVATAGEVCFEALVLSAPCKVAAGSRTHGSFCLARSVLAACLSFPASAPKQRVRDLPSLLIRCAHIGFRKVCMSALRWLYGWEDIVCCLGRCMGAPSGAACLGAGERYYVRGVACMHVRCYGDSL